jgi:DNA (cytosine-5)-methyltransferase 1
MRLLDLFCGAGGAAMGYHRAGFEVVGVDIDAQPYYPFEFIRADALTYPLDGFDAIHASPPCQLYSITHNTWLDRYYPDYLPAVRERLAASGVPWIIENVPGAPMWHGLLLCGSMFGLRVMRHRVFDSSHLLQGIDGHIHEGEYYSVTGHGERGHTGKRATIKDWREAMGIDWMPRTGLTQAIPPAYTEFLGRQIMEIVR